MAEDVYKRQSQSGFRYIAFKRAKMEEAFIAFCLGRNFFFRQQRSDFRTDQSGILHDVLCCAGMNAAAFDMNDCLCGIEVFVFQFADFAAVQCVGRCV